MIDERALYGQMRQEYQLLRRLLPYHGSLDLQLVINETARAARQYRCDTWQDAWNRASGATPTRNGFFEFHAHVRCSNCNGRRIDMRRGQVCMDCQGQGRKYERIRQEARYAPVPEPQGVSSEAPVE